MWFIDYLQLGKQTADGNYEGEGGISKQLAVTREGERPATGTDTLSAFGGGVLLRYLEEDG